MRAAPVERLYLDNVNIGRFKPINKFRVGDVGDMDKDILLPDACSIAHAGYPNERLRNEDGIVVDNTRESKPTHSAAGYYSRRLLRARGVLLRSRQQRVDIASG